MFFSSFFSLSLSTLKMTDAPGQGAERAAAANVGTCNDVPPQASGRGGGQEEEVRESTNRHQSSCRCWLAFFFFFNASIFAHLFLSFSLSLSLSPQRTGRRQWPLSTRSSRLDRRATSEEAEEEEAARRGDGKGGRRCFGDSGNGGNTDLDLFRSRLLSTARARGPPSSCAASGPSGSKTCRTWCFGSWPKGRARGGRLSR